MGTSQSPIPVSTSEQPSEPTNDHPNASPPSPQPPPQPASTPQTVIDPVAARLAQLRADIENRFVYHNPVGTQIGRYQALRDKAKEFAILIAELTPYSREQSLAITKLEESVFFANAAIARNEG